MFMVVHMEYYSAIKKNKMMPLGVTSMDLEIVILSDNYVRQRQIPYTVYIQSIK